MKNYNYLIKFQLVVRKVAFLIFATNSRCRAKMNNSMRFPDISIRTGTTCTRFLFHGMLVGGLMVTPLPDQSRIRTDCSFQSTSGMDAIFSSWPGSMCTIRRVGTSSFRWRREERLSWELMCRSTSLIKYHILKS